MRLRLLSLTEPVVIAHRGGSALRPENTIEAFDHAIALGVDALECDVHLSRDGQPVVLHDATLDRTTDAGGPVAAKTAAELASVNAAAHFLSSPESPWEAKPTGVPRLAELLDRYRAVPMVVEIKGDDRRVVPPVVDVIRAASAVDRAMIGGFSAEVLAEVRRLAPEIPTSASRVEGRSALFRSYLGLRPARTGAAAFQVPIRLKGRPAFGSAFVRAVRRGGVPVHVWVVNDPQEMERLLDWGVTGLITDRPDLALDVVRARRQTSPIHRAYDRAR